MNMSTFSFEQYNFSFAWCFPIGCVLSFVYPQAFVEYMAVIQLAWNAFLVQLLKLIYNVQYKQYG